MKDFDFYIVLSVVSFADVLIQKYKLEKAREEYADDVVKKIINRFFPFAPVFLTEKERMRDDFIKRQRRINFALLFFIVTFIVWIGMGA
ncbi:hypothetical protein R9C00_09325 [Flammeovirgaceae bacterium SG7u.111]|nr:hypothetical protein [Flammeovirgaceae bacterium SG7u.132]WPO37649.1 hypothetical protein R9C00_09325 [Flammeovirgaceae bacterium SG7u.111]